MVRIKMLTTLIGEDAQDWLVGEEYEASEQFARSLVGRQAAVAVGRLPAAPPITSLGFTHRDPGLT